MIARRLLASCLLGWTLAPPAAGAAVPMPPMGPGAGVGVAKVSVPTPDAGAPVLVPVPEPPPPAPLTRLEQTVEFLRLKEAFAREVPKPTLPTEAQAATWFALAQAELAAAGQVLDRPQLLVVVDRNPRVQQLMVVLAAPQDDWRIVGGTKVSTGATGRFDHYITPRGVFRITTDILGYRAEGTVNGNGIRGLGSKGMRVWDFGWHVALKGWDAGPGKPDRIPVRLMLHATDPDKLEGRIGRPASQGCVRVPSALNRFLDRHGVMDSEYERAAATELRFRALLLPDRTPTPLAGNTMVVIDSADRGTSVASRTGP